MELLGLNFYAEQKNGDFEDIQIIRRRVFKDLTKQLEFYDRNNKTRTREINKEIQERYLIKWNLHEGYSQFLANNPDFIQRAKARSENSLMLEVFDDFKKEKP